MKEVSNSFRHGMSLALAPAVLGLPAASYAGIAYSEYFRILHPAKAGETDRDRHFADAVAQNRHSLANATEIKCALRTELAVFEKVWRRGRDLNPRYGSPYT